MSKKKIAFVDRDGTLIDEPADEQIDSFEKLRLLPDVIPSLRSLVNGGFELVMVTNQDGLGTESFPQEDFDGPHNLMMHIFESQGVGFAAVHIDEHFPEDNAFTRKPEIGMVLDYLKSGDLDMENSCVIGDRQTDLDLAENMGIRGFRVGPDGMTWPEICEAILEKPRIATVHRVTNETQIQVAVNLDRTADNQFDTGVGFFDHMLEQLAKHGGFSLQLSCNGDLHVDAHHTVEDVALALGEAIDLALSDRRGIGRYGFVLPMDEAASTVAIDLSGRPVCVFEGSFQTPAIGDFPTEMFKHFFASFSQSLRAAIHIEFRGENDHHMAESIFKGVGRALRPALKREGHELPSTKGVL